MNPMAMNIILILMAFSRVFAAPSTENIQKEFAKILDPLQTSEGWKAIKSSRPELFKQVGKENPGPEANIVEQKVKVDGEDLIVGLGSVSVYVLAKPEVLKAVFTKPAYFQSLYGLDKPAFEGQLSDPNNFDGRIFKRVPGLENQDFTLSYVASESSGSWIQRAKMVADSKGFGVRDNIKIIEEATGGIIFREVSLFYPQRWWARLFSGTLKKVIKQEMYNIGTLAKCAGEKSIEGYTEEIAKQCQKEIKK